MSHSLKNIAILIDADNTPISLIDEILSKAESFGQVGIKKIYGDWGSDHLKSWQNVILKHAIIAVHQFAYTKGKNATDISMVIDAMDLVLENVYDGFCLVSSDSDFAPLAARLRANKIKVFGFGKPNTPASFQEACDEFICFQVPTKSEPEKNLPKQVSTESNTRAIPKKIKACILKAIDENADQNGWAALSHIVSAIRSEDETFDPKKYGFSKYPTLLNHIPEVEIKPQNNNYICRRKNAPAPKPQESKNLPLKIKNLIISAIQALTDETGWANNSLIANYIREKDASFSPKKYNFSTLSKLLDSIPEVEVKNSNGIATCRLKNMPAATNKTSELSKENQKEKKESKLNPSQITQEIMTLLKNSAHKKGWVAFSAIKNHFKKLDSEITEEKIISALEQANVQCLEIPKYKEPREKYYRKIPFLSLIEQLEKVKQRTDINIRDSDGTILACGLAKYAHFHVHYGKYGFKSFLHFFNEVVKYHERKKVKTNATQS